MEVLLVLAIFGIIAGLYVRIFHGAQLRQLEDGIYTSMGFNPLLTRFTIGGAFIVFVLWKAIKARKRRTRP